MSGSPAFRRLLPPSRGARRSALHPGVLLAAVLALALVVAGCGSTVQVPTGAARLAGPDGSFVASSGDALTGQVTGSTTGSTADDLSGPTGSGGLAMTGGGGGSIPVGGTTSAAGGGTDVTGDSGSTDGTGDTGGTDGSDDDTATTPEGDLKLGVMYAEGVDRLASSFGISGLTTGDTVAQTKAIVDYLNATGGIGGRQIELYPAQIPSNAPTPEQGMDTACRQLTEDDKVEYVVTFFGMTEGNMACFAKGGVTVLNDLSTLTSETMVEYADRFAAPGDIALQRMTEVLVDQLVSSGWLTKSSIIGAFSYDTAVGNELVDVYLTRALASHGLRIAEKQAVSQDTAGISQASAVVLKYAAKRVDRIIPLLANPLFVMQAASSQGYRPRYAMYSAFGPGALMETAAPRDQLEGSAGIGWSPYYDIGRGDRGGPVSPNESLCFEIMKDAGQNGSGTTLAFQTSLCNSLFYLQYAAKAVGGAPSNLIAIARGKVGRSFQAANTFRSDVGRHVDGVAAYRPITFVSSCSCYQYGPLRSAP